MESEDWKNLQDKIPKSILLEGVLHKQHYGIIGKIKNMERLEPYWLWGTSSYGHNHTGHVLSLVYKPPRCVQEISVSGSSSRFQWGFLCLIGHIAKWHIFTNEWHQIKFMNKQARSTCLHGNFRC